jgi:hypothetical protein
MEAIGLPTGLQGLGGRIADPGTDRIARLKDRVAEKVFVTNRQLLLPEGS